MARRGARTARGATVLVAALFAVLAGGCSGIVTLTAPQVAAEEVEVPEQSYVYDADGELLAVLRREFRDPVAFEDLPRHLVDAVLVAEDRRFWTHAGIDARAIARAALVNLATGGQVQGGSTVTQQLVKNLYMPTAPRTMETKLREALLAWDLEREQSKEEILERYLNTVYLGNGAYGVQAAAHTYFRKEAEDLDLAESALIAAMIRSPESGNPARDAGVARERRDLVLDALVEEELAGRDEADRARRRPVDVHPRPSLPEVRDPYWVDYVIRALLEDRSFGADEADRASRLYGGGLRIHTTLRRDVQEAAEAAAALVDVGPDGPEVGIVVLDAPTGRVLATVGGRDHDVRQFDLATQGRRQPGSAFKPFVLAAAVAAGWRPDSLVDGDPGSFDLGPGARYEVRNFGGSRPGTVSLAQATRASVNGAFVRVILDVGVDATITAARALGITSPLNPDPAIALGGLTHGVAPLEMAAAYATLGQMGMRVTPSPVERVEDAAGNVVWRPDRAPRQAVDPGVAWVVTQMLREVVDAGTGTRARIPGVEVAGKTGTTSDHTDAWFVGYTPTLAVAVWMGHPDRREPMRWIGGERAVTGGSWPARIWREVVAAILDPGAPTAFELPPGAAVEVEIDPESGLLAAPWCPGEVQTLPRILVPRQTCPSPAPSPSPEPDDDDADPDEGDEDDAGDPGGEGTDPGDEDEDPDGTDAPTPTPSPTPTDDADDGT